MARVLPSFYRFTFNAEWDEPIGSASNEIGQIKGLFSTKKAYASSYNEAKEKALESLDTELRQQLGSWKNFCAPSIEIETSWQENWYQYLFSSTPNKGFSFYLQEDSQA